MHLLRSVLLQLARLLKSFVVPGTRDCVCCRVFVVGAESTGSGPSREPRRQCRAAKDFVSDGKAAQKGGGHCQKCLQKGTLPLLLWRKKLACWVTCFACQGIPEKADLQNLL